MGRDLNRKDSHPPVPFISKSQQMMLKSLKKSGWNGIAALFTIGPKSLFYNVEFEFVFRNLISEINGMERDSWSQWGKILYL